MKVAVLFSGGKDSILALQESLRKGDEVRYLVSFFSDKPEPYMYNYSNMSFAIMQSLSLGIKLVTKKVEQGKEQEDMKKTLDSLKSEIEGLVVGVTLSRKQKDLLSRMCKSLGFKLLAPLARKKQDSLWKVALDSGFEIVIVYSKGMDRKWLGRTVGKKDIRSLSKKAAEFRTLVLNGPIFRSRMEITDSEAQWAGKEGRLLIKDAKLKGRWMEGAEHLQSKAAAPGPSQASGG